MKSFRTCDLQLNYSNSVVSRLFLPTGDTTIHLLHHYPYGKGLSFLVTIEPRTYIIELREKGKEHTRAISALFDTCQESKAVVVRQYSEILWQLEVTGEHKKVFGRIYRLVRQRIFSKEEIRNAESLCQSLSWPAEQV
jgi:hypothetical protein